MFGNIFVFKDNWYLFTQEREKESQPPYTFTSVCIFSVLFLINFTHATYKENVVKNQVLFQVCEKLNISGAVSKQVSFVKSFCIYCFLLLFVVPEFYFSKESVRDDGIQRRVGCD